MGWEYSLDHEKAREFQENIFFCFIDYIKAFNCVDRNELWKILKEMGVPDHLTCFLRNVGQEATVRTGHGTKDSFKIGKGTHQSCALSSHLFNFYAEYTCDMLGWMNHSWNQLTQKYQQTQKYRWYHSKGRKGREAKEPLDEGEGEESKSCLKTQHSKN